MASSSFSRRGLLQTVAAAAVAAGVSPSLAAPAKRPAAGGARSALPARKNLVIRNAFILTMDKAGDLPHADIHIRDGAIVAVGPKLQAPGAEVIDGSDTIVMPGMIDTHFHLWSSILRATSEGYFPLTLRVGPKYLPQDNYWGAKVGATECLLTGVTTVNDWCHNVMSPAHADAEVKALGEVGIRARFSYGWGQDLAVDKTMNLPDLARIKAQTFDHSDILSLGVAMRTPVEYQRGNVHMDVLIQDFQAARKLGLPITIHNRKGCIDALDKANLLGPDVLVVHPQEFTPAELKSMAAHGVKISSSPYGENRGGPINGRGADQLAELSELGIPIGLSVDEVVTNGKVDFFAVVREALKTQAQRPGKVMQLSPRRCLEMATIEGARALGMDSKIGSLVPGKRADLIMIRMTDLNMSPSFEDPTPVADPLQVLFRSTMPANIDTTIVDGRVLVRHGVLTSASIPTIVQGARKAVTELYARDRATTPKS